MEIRQLSRIERFDPDKMTKNAVFSSPHMFYDLYCLNPGQAQKVHAHEGSDKIYLVLRGAPSIQVGDETRTLMEGEAVLAPAGAPHGVRNDAATEAVLLVTMAPLPTS